MNSQEMTKTASDKPGLLYKEAANAMELRAIAKKLGVAGHEAMGTKELQTAVRAGGSKMGVLSSPESGRMRLAKGAPAQNAGRLQSPNADVLRSRAQMATAEHSGVAASANQQFKEANPGPRSFFGKPSSSAVQAHQADRNIAMANAHNANFSTPAAGAAGAVGGAAEGGAMGTFRQKAGEVFNQHIKPNWKPIAGGAAAGIAAGSLLSQRSNQQAPAYAY
jgi:hypothetical protein